MSQLRNLAVVLIGLLALTTAHAESPPAEAVEAGEPMRTWQGAANAAAEAAAARDAAKAAEEARKAANEAQAKAKAAADEAAKAAAAAKPVAPPKAADVAPVASPAAMAVTSTTASKEADNPDPESGAGGVQTSKTTRKPAKELFGAAKTPASMAPKVYGGYAKGCLAGGKALPIDGPAWQAMRLSRNRNWGHPKLIALLERFAGEMQKEEKWPGLLIGDLAQPRGGPMLTGHKSHQLGLDADIWFKPMPANRLTSEEREKFEPLLLAKDNGSEVIAENWNEGYMRLVRRAAKYPEVERIFVHPAIKKAFCQAAGTDRNWLRKVRPMWLHNYHFHVRMHCPSDSPGCVPQQPTLAEDGCGKELDDWIKLVSKPPKPAPKPTVPVKPSKPPPPLMLRDLPPECSIVIGVRDPKPTPAKAPVLAKAGKSKTKSAAQQ
jgi:penicillin-insensitive murein endopeptidase